MTLVDQLDAEDRKFLEEGIRFNLRLAEHGLKFGSGLGVGRTLERLARQGLIKRDMILAARILTSAAADARMAGVKMAAMSSAGSGNHGLTAILPIRAVQDYLDVEHATVLEAIALSHIITAYIKAHTGRLSAVCGCSIAAGAGATAGVTYLVGGDVRHIAGAIKNVIDGPGRGHLRRRQGRLRPEAVHRRRHRGPGGPVLSPGGQRPGHRRHHRRTLPSRP